jgi:hypothetical protein
MASTLFSAALLFVFAAPTVRAESHTVKFDNKYVSPSSSSCRLKQLFLGAGMELYARHYFVSRYELMKNIAAVNQGRQRLDHHELHKHRRTRRGNCVGFSLAIREPRLIIFQVSSDRFVATSCRFGLFTLCRRLMRLQRRTLYTTRADDDQPCCRRRR